MKNVNSILYMMFIGMCAVMFTACSAGKASDAFKDGSVKIGSTYQEMVDVIGEPTKKYESDICMMAQYTTLITDSHVFVLLEQNEEQGLVITDISDDKIKGAVYQLKVKSTN